MLKFGRYALSIVIGVMILLGCNACDGNRSTLKFQYQDSQNRWIAHHHKGQIVKGTELTNFNLQPALWEQYYPESKYLVIPFHNSYAAIRYDNALYSGQSRTYYDQNNVHWRISKTRHRRRYLSSLFGLNDVKSSKNNYKSNKSHNRKTYRSRRSSRRRR